MGARRIPGVGPPDFGVAIFDEGADGVLGSRIVPRPEQNS
jgi:hypothetical protein